MESLRQRAASDHDQRTSRGHHGGLGKGVTHGNAVVKGVARQIHGQT